MAKTIPLRWSSVICLALLLGACAHARIVRRDYPEASAPPPRPVAATPTPVTHTTPTPATHATPTPLLQATAPQPLPPEAIPPSETYIVKAGDTLFGIARRFGLKFKDVADWNRIAEPYAIQSGQRLHLHAPTTQPMVEMPKPLPTFSAPPGVPSNTQTVVAPVVQGGATSASGTNPSSGVASGSPKPPTSTNANGNSIPASTATSMVSTPVTIPRTPTPPKPQDVSPPKPIIAAPPVATVPTTASATASTPAMAPPTTASVGTAVPGGPSWRWPTDGEIIGRYVTGDQTQQGIDIGGRSGQAVIAAADGVVVYSGAGLVGYGELVIIKHSDEWLSAYAHNRRRLVAEGTKVKAGEAIAEMGRTGAVSDMLHFEIRRNGKPVDPLLYLPKK
jgi:lipoprotein NlpD